MPFSPSELCRSPPCSSCPPARGSRTERRRRQPSVVDRLWILGPPANKADPPPVDGSAALGLGPAVVDLAEAFAREIVEHGRARVDDAAGAVVRTGLPVLRLRRVRQLDVWST